MTAPKKRNAGVAPGAGVDTVEQTSQQNTAATPTPQAPVKRGRGRPPGSKNKPKATRTPQAPTATALATIADQIKAEHQAAQTYQRQSLAHAFRCGELLCEAKAAMPHGEWSAWLAANVKFSDTAARGYMRLAMMDEAKRQRVADLSLREALKQIANQDQHQRRIEKRVDEELIVERLFPALAVSSDNEAPAREGDTIKPQNLPVPTGGRLPVFSDIPDPKGDERQHKQWMREQRAATKAAAESAPSVPETEQAAKTAAGSAKDEAHRLLGVLRTHHLKAYVFLARACRQNWNRMARDDFDLFAITMVEYLGTVIPKTSKRAKPDPIDKVLKEVEARLNAAFFGSGAKQ